MSNNSKQLSNPFSTGGGGGHFEAHVQASFVTLMLTGGYAPCLPCWPIKEIKLQGRINGFETDDLIVIVENNNSKEKRKLIGQIKHSIRITQKDSTCSEVIQAAWNDFKNPKIFTKNRDIIALITGPLSATDSHNVQWLLNQARHTKNVDEFNRHVNQANFSPSKSREKLDVFKHHLKLANNNNEISNDELYSFLNHFNLLGYDLGDEIGVVLSLLHSHILQFNQQNPQLLWSRIVDIVQTWNKDAGTITPEKLPEDLKESFKQPTVMHFPSELKVIQPELMKIDWNKYQHSTDLALVNLIGSWYEKNEADISIISKLTNENYETWVIKIREILQFSNSPFSLQNGHWKISNRTKLLDETGSRIFDQNLDTLKGLAVSVLTEHDPSFELPVNERFAASIHGKVLTYSQILRKGLAEGLAMLGNNSEKLTNCSQNKAKDTVILAVREILASSDWVLWGSLNNLLPLLAEAAPDSFLDAVEKMLSLSPCPFDNLFSQEGNGVTGGNYMTGLLWALEALAWDENYLIRVCVIFGELAIHDPGGNWSNRPANSLSTILLPWHPQTIGPIEKRKVAIQTLSKECPEIAWKLIINMLPNQHQISSGSYKPSWRKTIPDDWEKGVTQKEYWEQISFYSECAVSLANSDMAKLVELIEHFASLPKTSFDRLLNILSSDAIIGLPDENRIKLWNKLTIFIYEHRRFSDAEWSLNTDLLNQVEAVTDKLSPSNPYYLYQLLFSNRDFDLYEDNDDYEKQEKDLNERRQKALKTILDTNGINSVIEFAEVVKSPHQVGFSLAYIADEKIDKILIPQYLNSKNEKLKLFISDYILKRQNIIGWSWTDGIDKTNWTIEQISQFLCFLPFTNETWNRVSDWLGKSQDKYWLNTQVFPYQSDSDLEIAIDKLIEYGRPHAAIRCLDRIRLSKQPINLSQCISALLAALSSTEPSYSIDVHDIVELIKILQESSEVNRDAVFNIEWAYLRLLDSYRSVSPKLLENRLANDPEFFCEVIRLIFRSKNNDEITDVQSEENKEIASNAWRLLHAWRTPPGMQEDGKVNDTIFSDWLQKVKEICTESGHLEVALNNIGEVLIYCPPDENGLWINRTVADALNARDAEEMRSGFRTGFFNSRGFHWVDPSGKPEIELSEKYKKMAEDIENAGYHRLAVTLRNLSESYISEAERIINEHKSGDED